MIILAKTEIWTHQIFYNYQIIIAGALGFLGVIITIRQNRIIQERIRKIESDTRKVRAKTALVAELELLAEMLRSQVKSLENPGGSKLLIPTKRLELAFREFFQDLSLLGVSEVKTIIYTYYSLYSLYDSLGVLGEISEENPGYAEIDKGDFQHLAELMRDSVKKIEKALGELGG